MKNEDGNASAFERAEGRDECVRSSDSEIQKA